MLNLCLAELSLASEIIATIFVIALVIFLCFLFLREYKAVQAEREQERVFKEQLLLHYENIDHNLCLLCRTLDEDIVFD